MYTLFLYEDLEMYWTSKKITKKFKKVDDELETVPSSESVAAIATSVAEAAVAAAVPAAVASALEAVDVSSTDTCYQYSQSGAGSNLQAQDYKCGKVHIVALTGWLDITDTVWHTCVAFGWTPAQNGAEFNFVIEGNAYGAYVNGNTLCVARQQAGDDRFYMKAIFTLMEA